jgi:hypothetical protein
MVDRALLGVVDRWSMSAAMEIRLVPGSQAEGGGRQF